jgi:hypothetical protein
MKLWRLRRNLNLHARIVAKMRQLAETRPALARLFELWIDEALSR